MKPIRYGKELAELTEIWNCGECEAVQHFLHAIYIARGHRPTAAAEIFKGMTDDALSRVFVEVMDETRKPRPSIDLLDLQPVSP